MKGSGEMIKKVVKGLKYFPIELSISDSLKKESLMVQANIYGLQVNNIKVTGEMDKDTDQAHGNHQKSSSIKASGVLANQKVMEPLPLRMETLTKVNSKMLYDTVKVFRSSVTEICTEVVT